MDFDKKLAEIRSKPERERMRYVYVCVAIVMVLVVFIWVLSLRITFYDLRPDPGASSSVDTITERLNETLDEGGTPSIDDLIEDGTAIKENLDDLSELEDVENIEFSPEVVESVESAPEL